MIFQVSKAPYHNCFLVYLPNCEVTHRNQSVILWLTLPIQMYSSVDELKTWRLQKVLRQPSPTWREGHRLLIRWMEKQYWVIKGQRDHKNTRTHDRYISAPVWHPTPSPMRSLSITWCKVGFVAFALLDLFLKTDFLIQCHVIEHIQWLAACVQLPLFNCTPWSKRSNKPGRW